MLDQPTSSVVLWEIYDQIGIRPEYLLPVLYSESGLNPSVPNRAGAPYYGINQISASYLAALGFSVDDYLTWSASDQLARVVLPYLRGVVSRYGAIGSGTRLYQANFYPASLDYARGLSDPIVSANPDADHAYRDNREFDRAGKGYITPDDLATFVRTAASSAAVEQAIADAYELRPLESPNDPAYGTDFGVLSRWAWPLTLGGGAALGLGAWWAGWYLSKRGGFPRWL